MRILVTRSQADAERTAARLDREGHEAVLAPVLAVTPLPFVLSGRFDALAATSRHAFHTAHALGRHLPVFAVGRSTAEAAREAGFEDVRIAAGDGDSLASLLRLTLPPSSRVLYLAGRDRKPTLEEALPAAGYLLAVAEVYAAEAIAAWPREVTTELAAGRIAAALHYSSRSADLALAAARRGGVVAPFLELRHLCISADAATPLRAAEAPDVAVASRPEEESLLALLDSACAGF